MSGNRTLHREQIGLSLKEEGDAEATKEPAAFWSLASSPLLGSSSSLSSSAQPLDTTTTTTSENWMVWVAGSNGASDIRGYTVGETSLQDKQDRLEASALKLQWSHTCLDDDHNNHSQTLLGTTCLDTIRNYTGQDTNAGDLLLLSLDLSNTVRIWNLEDHDDANHKMVPAARFVVEQATGTTAALLPPRLALTGDPHAALEKVVTVAVGCLDGTVALVSTGIPLFNPHQKKPVDPSKLPAPGTVLVTFGSPGGSRSNVPLSLQWHPVVSQTLCVGHGNGIVHLYSKNAETQSTKHYRLTNLGTSPVRAVTFTTDGHLLIAANDQGRLCVWDCSNRNIAPALVHHLPHAHSSWILRAIPIDDRRFCTLGADQTISVWNVGQLHQATHTFQSNQSLWSLTAFLDQPKNTFATNQKRAPRLVAGSDNGWLEFFSLEANS